MRSLCASDGWGHCILWLKKATVPTLTGTTDVDNLIRHFFTEDIGTSIYWYLDYKLNFCEDTELLPSFYPQFQVKDRNALNVLLIFSLFDFWRKLTLFLSSLHRFNLENFWIYNIYSYTYMHSIWCWTWIKGADFHQKTLWSIYSKM